jgi:hypothetical protein
VRYLRHRLLVLGVACSGDRRHRRRRVRGAGVRVRAKPCASGGEDEERRRHGSRRRALYCFNLAFEPQNFVVHGEGVFSSTSAAVPSAIIPAPSSGTWACPEGYRSAAVHSPMDRNFYPLFN